MTSRQIGFRAENELIARFDAAARGWGTNRTALLNMLMEEAASKYESGGFLFQLGERDTTQNARSQESARS